ncbi:helix-turn-helix domain-containing protein [Ruthenibacterium lactatiformans]|uniref:helix-turn-helix domain-containing protein n=1 Tax=Ruthenibacterium lactatiformans TaxID=1550024 RepID=UPI00210DE900|nr:helix-turn-helix domain-containing protein [Ruthenibacterium lactatiformans]MCQ5089455.1 helix-turn-helix domain-containing protein [Ruthenibacterium lactatiformans]
MPKKEAVNQSAMPLPMLKTVEQMSRISGIGENKLRELMDSGELEYIQNGNRRLIADSAIWEWYHRAKKKAQPPVAKGGQ